MMNPTTATRLLRSTTASITTPRPAAFLIPALQRAYATHHQTSSSSSSSSSSPETKRRAVTPFNDDGHVPWSDLSIGEKTGRAAQQSFNFGIIIVGLVLTGGVGYFFYKEVISSDSKVAFFNRAVDRIKQDPRCLELLGDPNKIVAFGEETHNKWRRARPIASTVSKDRYGNESLMMHFNVKGPKGSGIVSLHLVKPVGQSEYQYKYFFLDAKGHHRLYLENADADKAKGKKEFRFLGIKWN